MHDSDNDTYTADVHELPKDMKRVLKVQFREFIHFVEDAQDRICYGNNFSRSSNSQEAA